VLASFDWTDPDEIRIIAPGFRSISIYPLSNLFPSGLPTRESLTSADVTLLHFAHLKLKEQKAKNKGRESTREQRGGEGRAHDRTKRRRSRNEQQSKRGQGEGEGRRGGEGYPRARQHDYEPQLCLRRLPATQRSSGTVGYESSSDDLFGNNRPPFVYVNSFRAIRAVRPMRA